MIIKRYWMIIFNGLWTRESEKELIEDMVVVLFLF